MPRYPEALKTKMVLRMTGPRAVSASALAQETHIPQTTLSRWLLQFATLRGVNNDKPAPDHAETDAAPPDPPATHRARGAEEKLRLVALADTLGEQELGALLRREGLHAADIEAWRADMLAALTQRSKGASEATAARLDDRRRIQELERELHRKDKALAEAAALLVLQKTVSCAGPTCAGEARVPQMRYHFGESGRSGRELFGDCDPVKKHGPGTAMDLALVTPSGDPV